MQHFSATINQVNQPKSNTGIWMKSKAQIFRLLYWVCFCAITEPALHLQHNFPLYSIFVRVSNTTPRRIREPRSMATQKEGIGSWQSSSEGKRGSTGPQDLALNWHAHIHSHIYIMLLAFLFHLFFFNSLSPNQNMSSIRTETSLPVFAECWDKS